MRDCPNKNPAGWSDADHTGHSVLDQSVALEFTKPLQLRPEKIIELDIELSLNLVFRDSAITQAFLDNSAANQVVSLQSSASPKGSVYTAAPNDSGVGGFVGTINLSTGFITPVAIGLSSPHGMVFVPNAM